MSASGVHSVVVRWQQTSGDFVAGTYLRRHEWAFDGGMKVAAAASPQNVKVPYTDPTCVDPEEALVAAVSSCHMLTYLYLCHRAGFRVGRYEDRAMGMMAKDERGAAWVAEVELRPVVEFEGERRPSAGEDEELHHQAHEQCIIANSVKTRVRVRLGG